MLIIVDFNNTLFNTQKFKSALSNCLEGLGVSQDLFWSTYPQALRYNLESSGYLFNNHLAILSKEIKVNKRVALNELNKVLHNAQDFLFDDTFEFFDKAKETNSTLILLTLGKDNFESEKIKYSKIAEFFHEIYITDKDKNIILPKIIDKFSGSNNKNIFFINDHIRENLAVMKYFPQIKPILKLRHDIDYNPYDLKKMLVLDSLKEIGDFLVNYHKINWHELK